ncbi:hypothetical protein, partial [Phascolarctobacterium succinatutens]|uniref:hypothetical protein n=1 Tax=Phascolarctobacterium succinatutens TaxID=626940 RepID=UPI0023F47BB7
AFPHYNYSKMHITVRTPKKTKLTPAALNIVTHLHAFALFIFLFAAVFLQPVGFFPHLLSIIALFCILYTVFSKKF